MGQVVGAKLTRLATMIMLSALVCSSQRMMLASPGAQSSMRPAMRAPSGLAPTDRRVIVQPNRGRAKAESVVGEIVAAGGNEEAVVLDVTESEPTATGLADILAAALIQILINNAGIYADAVFPGLSGEQWDSVIDVSLSGFFDVTRPLIVPMIRTRWGRIVTVSSTRPSPATAARSTTRRRRVRCMPRATRWPEKWPAAASRSTPWRRGSSPPGWPMAFSTQQRSRCWS